MSNKAQSRAGAQEFFIEKLYFWLTSRSSQALNLFFGMKMSWGISTRWRVDDNSSGSAFTKKTVKKNGLPNLISTPVTFSILCGKLSHATDRPVQDDHKFPLFRGFVSCDSPLYGDFLTDKGLPQGAEVSGIELRGWLSVIHLPACPKAGSECKDWCCDQEEK